MDGSADSGVLPAQPRHWLIAAGVVIAAQWLIGVGDALAHMLVLLLPTASLVDWGESAAIWAPHVFFSNVLPFGMLAAAAIGVSRRLDGRGARALGVTWRAWRGLPWALVGLTAALPTLLQLVSLPPEAIAQLAEALIVLIPSTTIQAGAEEILFRGVILTMLVARYGSLAGLIISAALFGFWHLSFSAGVADALINVTTTLVFGLTSGVVALRQGHLGGVIALHTVWNVASGVSAGFEDWPADFWSSYSANFYAPWTFDGLVDEGKLNSALLPLMIETALILVICKTTIYEVIERRGIKRGDAPI